MLRIRQTIAMVLAWLMLRLGDPGATERFCKAYLRERRYTLFSRDQLEVARLEAAFVRQKLRKLGGGNVSKLRDPRKTMTRVVRRFEKLLEAAS